MTYKHFAYVYDDLMKDAPYQMWTNWILELLSMQTWTNPTVVELGCGTGSILIPLAEEGIDIVGVDLSEEMLSCANQKAANAGVKPILLHQDMRQLQLDSPVQLIYSLCDSLNYLLDEDDVKETFKRVYISLVPGGLWAFDYHTEYMLSTILGNETFTERDERISYIWDSSYNDDTQTVTYDISFFVKEDDKYRRFEEIHEQRAYSTEQITTWLTEAGFAIEAVHGDFTNDLPHSETERLFFIARKK